MQAFAVTENLTLHADRFFRKYIAIPSKPTTEAIQVEMDKVYLDLYGEMQLVATELQRVQSRAATGAALLTFAEEGLLFWEGCPALLGRYSSKLNPLPEQKNSKTLHSEAAPLVAQLKALRLRNPNKYHFRIAILNGFGISLSDFLVGMAALRLAAKEMAEHLPSFAIDILLGPAMGQGLSDLMLTDSWLEQVFYHAPTMQDLSRYDAMIDLTSPYNLPHYGEMPPVDWYLWWFGLDASAYSSEEKRNQIPSVAEARKEVAAFLPKKKQGYTVFFSTSATNSIQDMPLAQAAVLAKELLEADEKLHLIQDQPLGISHPRLLDMSAHLSSAEEFRGLISAVDALISVDSFAMHLADATSTPCLALFSTLPEDWYSNYSYCKALSIPGAASLPGYKKMQMETEEWKKTLPSYEKAWSELKAATVLSALQSCIKNAEDNPAPKKKVINREISDGFPHEVVTTEWIHAQNRIAILLSSLLKTGGHAVMAGCGQPPLGVVLARFLAPLGQLHVFEPRRLRAQALCADLARGHVYNAQVYQHLPVAPQKEAVMVQDTDPWTESNPSFWGNINRPLRLATSPVDALQLPICHALVIQPPMPIGPVLAGALETMRRCRPLLVISPIGQEECATVLHFAQQAQYKLWAEPAHPEGNLSQLLLVGLPQEAQADMTGFIPVEIKAE